jgi:hypothetical protein
MESEETRERLPIGFFPKPSPYCGFFDFFEKKFIAFYAVFYGKRARELA